MNKYTELQKPPYKKKKSKHYQNDRITENVVCEMCKMRNATENHELKGGHSFRNSSCENEFQLKLCRTCHHGWEQQLSKIEKDLIRAIKQRDLMDKNDWTVEQFRDRIGISYL